MTSSFRQILRVERQIRDGSYVDGEYVFNRDEEGSIETFGISASKHPLSGKEMQALPEGRREKGAFAIITEFRLRTADVELKKNPDIVNIEDEWYEVFSVQPWQNNVISHYRAVVTKVGQ